MNEREQCFVKAKEIYFVTPKPVSGDEFLIYDGQVAKFSLTEKEWKQIYQTKAPPFQLNSFSTDIFQKKPVSKSQQLDSNSNDEENASDDELYEIARVAYYEKDQCKTGADNEGSTDEDAINDYAKRLLDKYEVTADEEENIDSRQTGSDQLSENPGSESSVGDCVEKTTDVVTSNGAKGVEFAVKSDSGSNEIENNNEECCLGRGTATNAKDNLGSRTSRPVMHVSFASDTTTDSNSAVTDLKSNDNQTVEENSKGATPKKHNSSLQESVIDDKSESSNQTENGISSFVPMIPGMDAKTFTMDQSTFSFGSLGSYEPETFGFGNPVASKSQQRFGRKKRLCTRTGSVRNLKRIDFSQTPFEKGDQLRTGTMIPTLSYFDYSMEKCEVNTSTRSKDEKGNVKADLPSLPATDLFERDLEYIVDRHVTALDHVINPFDGRFRPAFPSQFLVCWCTAGEYSKNLYMPHGHGTLKTQDGHVIYVGNFEKGRFQGFGSGLILTTLSSIQTEAGYYQGLWRRNYRHGEGTMTFLSGKSYDGSWYFDKRCGYGCCNFPDGSRLFGYYADNAPDGAHIYRDIFGVQQLRYFDNGTLIPCREVKEHSDNRCILVAQELKPCVDEGCSTSNNPLPEETCRNLLRSLRKEFDDRTGDMVTSLGQIVETGIEKFARSESLCVQHAKTVTKISKEFDKKLQEHIKREEEHNFARFRQEKTIIDKLDQIHEEVRQNKTECDNLRKQLEEMTCKNKQLKDEMDKIEDSYKCEICRVNPRNCIVMPCMHMNSCSDCISKLKCSHLDAKCPICRGPIRGDISCKLK